MDKIQTRKVLLSVSILITVVIVSVFLFPKRKKVELQPTTLPIKIINYDSILVLMLNDTTSIFRKQMDSLYISRKKQNVKTKIK
jgi:hypothetical protein